MRPITMNVVRSRLKWLQRSTNDVFVERSQLNSYNRVNDIKRFIEGCYKSNSNADFYVYCDLLETVARIGNTSELNHIGNYIIENMVHRVRSAKETNTLLKTRLTRMQNKTKPAIADSIETIMVSTDPSNFGIGGSSAPTTTTTVQPSTPSNENDKALEEIYTRMLEEVEVVENCDRVLENYNRISKRFNIEKLFTESKLDNEDIVISLCNMVDTYNMPTATKFNSVIETALYGFESNRMQYTKKEILETAINYFLFKEDGLDACRSILEATVFYDKDKDMKDLDIITEEEPEAESTSIGEAIINSVSTSAQVLCESNKDFNEIFNKFKREELGKDNKPQNKIKGLIDSLYRKDVNSIIEKTPDLLSWLRKFFILGSFAVPVIGPVLGGVTYIADKFVSLHYDRNECPKIIKAFNKELKECRAKLKTIEVEEDKEKLSKYIDSVKKARDKVNEYYIGLLTEKEQEEYYEKMDFDDGSSIDDFDFDDFFEGTVFNGLEDRINRFIEIKDSNIINEESMFNLIKNLDDNNISTLSKIVSKHPSQFYKEAVMDGITDTIHKLRIGKLECGSDINKSIRIATLNSALTRINESGEEYKFDGSFGDISNCIEDFVGITEAYSAIAMMMETYNNSNPVLEAFNFNALNVAGLKLRNSLTKMSDKERAVSKSLDVGMNNFKKGIERALTNDNREAIIKGSILPSFSKIVKLAIVNAGLVALGQPVVAVIGTIAYFAMSSKFKAKERQMVVDELEIELDMCERYINIAESKNDMVALRQLLTTKKELQRQLQRIKYKMKVDFGQKYYDAKAPNN